MKKTLTYRQLQFLRKFLDIHQGIGQPVHYITVAEQMGVGKVTSYEMLRLLEDRGFVKAEYQPNPDQHGPGRSVVLFYPTVDGENLVKNLPGLSTQDEDWEITRDHLLDELSKAKPEGYEGLMTSLLAHIPEDRSPLTYATELITTIIITLASFKDIPVIRAILVRLSRIGLPHEISLNVMSGISMFLSVWERTNQISGTFLMSQLDRFEKVISQLSEESKKKLSDYTRDLIRLLSI
jgi:hypothetical protein